MHTSKTCLIGLVLTVLMLVSTPGFSKEIDTYTGTIDLVSIKNNRIIVNDHAFPLRRNFVVKNTKGKTVSAFNLRRGSRVRVHLDEEYHVIWIEILQ